MEFIQKPDTLTFAATMPNFIVSGVTEKASVKLLMGSEELVNETMFNSDAGLVIDVKDIVNEALSVQIPTSPIFCQNRALGLFTLEVSSEDDSLSYSFNAIRGGYEGISIPSEYNAMTVLYTFQPATKIITTDSPEWLTFFVCLRYLAVRFRYYFSDGSLRATAYIEDFYSGTPGLYTIDCSYAKAHELSIPVGGIGYAYYDVDLVSLSNGIAYPASPTQRYLVTQATDSHKYYLFENTLGGIDTLICTGDLAKRVSYSADITENNNEMFDTANSHSLTFEQVVGVFSSDIELMWFRDFILSSQRYEVKDGNPYKIIIEDTDTEISLANADIVSFTFRRATEDKYSGFIRQRFELPTGLIFDGPDDTDFF